MAPTANIPPDQPQQQASATQPGSKREATTPATGHATKKQSTKTKYDTATNERPYVTTCSHILVGNEPCRQQHAHTDKLKTKNNSAALKDFYCWACKTQKSLTTHLCVVCQHSIKACQCTINEDAATGQRKTVVNSHAPLPAVKVETASSSTATPTYTVERETHTPQITQVPNHDDDGPTQQPPKEDR
jgi:hypothetical protein